MSELVTEQQPPTPNTRPPVWPLVVADMQERDRDGRAKYGVPLQPFNGRKALVDAYQEVLDLAVYLRQEIEERKELEAELARTRGVALRAIQLLSNEGFPATADSFTRELEGKWATYRISPVT